MKRTVLSIPPWFDCGLGVSVPPALTAGLQSHLGSIAAAQHMNVRPSALAFNPTLVRLRPEGHRYFPPFYSLFQSHLGSIAATL